MLLINTREMLCPWKKTLMSVLPSESSLIMAAHISHITRTYETKSLKATIKKFL